MKAPLFAALIAAAIAAPAFGQAADTPRDSFLSAWNTGAARPGQFEAIDQPRYTEEMIAAAQTACLANDPRASTNGCATIGFIAGRRAELAYRAHAEANGLTYLPMPDGAADSAAADFLCSTSTETDNLMDRARRARAAHSSLNPRAACDAATP